MSVMLLLSGLEKVEPRRSIEKKNIANLSVSLSSLALSPGNKEKNLYLRQIILESNSNRGLHHQSS